MDDDGFDPDPIRLHCKLTKKKDEILIDFRESSKQVKGSINMTEGFSKSAAYACIRSVMDPSIPNNDGFFRPIKFLSEPGNFLHCTFPAPVAARGVSAMRTTEVVWGALAQMLPHKVFACGVQGDFGVTIFGYDTDNKPFISLEFLFSSWRFFFSGR